MGTARSPSSLLFRGLRPLAEASNLDLTPASAHFTDQVPGLSVGDVITM